MLRVDVTYLTGNVHASQFPLDAATLFQAMVQRNAHRLDEARPALEALEQSTCVRIECASATKTGATVAVPRMPKPSETGSFVLGDTSNKLMVYQAVFRFDDKDGVHLRYFFDVKVKQEWLPFFEPFRLGHGESLCVSKATLVDALPSKTVGLQAWEPSRRGRQMRVLRSGLLYDLILYHNAKKSSHEVEQSVAFFSTEPREARLFYRFYCDGEPYAFHKWQLPTVAGMIRHAVIEQVPASLKEYASNHCQSQLQYLPLPTVGKFSDGRIRRAIIIDTLGSLPVHRVTELVMKDLKGNVFTAVRQTDTDSVFEQYLTPARHWVTVTPVLLNGYDTKHGKKDLKKRQKMLTKMFRVIGLPFPRAVQTFGALERFEASNKHGKSYIRLMLAVEFDREVAGMVVVGAGRNAGMGIFANLAPSATA
jgi:hypothetical protein